MKKEIKLLQYEEKYREEIDKMLDDILDMLVEFYKDYDNVFVTGASYDSTVGFGGQDSKIKFSYATTGGYYPEFSMGVSRLGSAFRTPKARFFSGVFVMKGVSKEFVDEMYRTFKTSSLIMVSNDTGGMGSPRTMTPKEKMEDLFKLAKEQLGVWAGQGVSSDIFMF